jgi:hypothetical protein
MSYCNNQDVIDITGSSLSTTIIDRIIAGSDRLINRHLVQGGLTANPSPTPDDLMDASIYLSAATVLNRHMIDGTLPAEFTAENLKEKIDAPTVIKNYNAIAVQAITLYIKNNTNLDSDIDLVRVVGKSGEKV